MITSKEKHIKNGICLEIIMKAVWETERANEREKLF